MSGKPGSFLSLGLIDNPENRKVALAKAALLESDILYERVDPTLDRYRVLKSVAVLNPPSIIEVYSLGSLYSDYTESKKGRVRPGTYKNGYLVNLSHIKKSPYFDINVLDVSDVSYAQKIADWASQTLTIGTGKRLIVQLNACFDWGIKLGKLKLKKSPFSEIEKQFEAKQRKTDENWTNLAFTAKERDRILNYLKQDSKGCIYYGYTAFCFYTGARPGEVRALTWDDITPNCTHINFNKEIVDGKGGRVTVQGLKTEEKRLFPINEQLRQILIEQKKQATNSDNLVFTSLMGCPVNPSGYFRPKIWRPTLAALNIAYRKPYCTRHTFITLCLESGMPVKDLAKLVGNSVNIIHKHYAGVNVRMLTVPTL
ncbi:hypothetical protein WN50_28250 [Limnoraphis robusta CS-951]|uniref:Tyr recombinase domain-containing protein n=1 Tax=Limnoraphis robusta CS-951 TaxID=1637645 RepID=A0A0F5Y7R7_9CYAN|nr:hypothetical protein WN50_28250 [Limnoraphis robusta CS-951]